MGLTVTALLACSLALARPAAADCPPLPSPNQAAASSSTPPLACRFDAALTRLFTPPDVPKDTYRAYVADAGIEKVAAAFRQAALPTGAEGAWEIEAIDPLGAFGESGVYDRAKVARLYLGIRARVARGPIVVNGRTVRSVTLVSPCPDATLSKLNPGTLIIDFNLQSVIRGR